MFKNALMLVLGLFFLFPHRSYAQEPSLADIQKLYKDALVFIAVEFETPDGKSCEVGTGFIISSSGYVVTSRHLITDEKGELYKKYSIAGSVRDPFNCEKPRGLVKDLLYVKSDQDQDVMLLKFSSEDTYNYVKACQQTIVDNGEPLYMLGFPLGKALIADEVRRGYTTGPRGRWQISGSINEGNSGGPVFNKYGRLVGLIYGDYDKAKNYGYMVPFDHFKDFFAYASASIEPCETPTGEFSPSKCSYKQKNYDIDYTLSEHTGFGSSSRDYIASFSSDPGYLIGSWEWRAGSVNNASGIEVNLSEDRRSIRVQTTLRSGPVFDRWRGWIKGTIILSQIIENCPRVSLGTK